MESYTEFAKDVENASKILRRDVASFKESGVKTKAYKGFENFLRTNKYILENNPYSYEYVVGGQ
jgi:hypothetical protein